MLPPTLASPQAAARDEALVAGRLARWRRAGESCGDPALGAFVAASLADGPLRPLLRGVFAGSPFLTDCLIQEPDILRRFAADGPEAVLAATMRDTAALRGLERARLMAGLRRQRRRWALLTALADLAGRWDLGEVTGALTAAADLAVQLAVEHLAATRTAQGEGPGSAGLVVLAMGKHGAGELNYSSDIDLIVLFDEALFRPGGREPAMAHAVRLARGLVHLLEAKTADGFVFRTDLRLRPHLPGHPLAISTAAAELYYERHGQNWERAALIKARPVAGDLEAGRRFLAALTPFVWRRHLDYAAIRDIHAIKRQINAHRGFADIQVRGHDLKVGRGGIREIEFFAQTQQLILGGRVPALRGRATLDTLDRLARERWIAAATAAELRAVYGFLRALEHRLQMVADRQTQLVPANEGDFGRFAAFAGFAEPAGLEAALAAALLAVERHYAALFEAEPDLGASGSLVFTGTGDDPDTLKTLARIGFRQPEGVAARLRAWHHGHIKATRSTRARELLTELTPGLLATLQVQPDPDAAFALLDAFLSGLPAGVQIFSLFRANPRLLALVTDLVGTAPRLAKLLAARVDLLDAMLTPDFFEALPARAALARELRSRLGDAKDLQDTLDLCRRWAHGRQFQAGLQVLLGLSAAHEAALTLTAIAEITLAVLLESARGWLVGQHGRIPGGAFVILGMGKLGSRELSFGSDLDLVFVYDAPEGAGSDGARPLPAATYYARLSQRLVSAVAASTAEGILFEIDTRLRPSGNLGPVACSLANFRRYQEVSAQTWEQQALCRARVVAGDPELAQAVEAVRRSALRRRRDPLRLAADVRAMRERIFREHGSDAPWQLKHGRGGIVEVEFVAQFLALAHGHAVPGLLATGTAAQITAAGEAGILDTAVAERLVAALHLFASLQAVRRLSLEAPLVPAKAPPRLLEALRRAGEVALGDTGLVTFAVLEGQLIAAQAAVRQVFDELCPPPLAGEAANAGVPG